MKKSELVFSAILVPIDYLMIVLAGVAAYAVRFGDIIQVVRPVFYELPHEQYLRLVFLSAPLFLLIFAISGLYAIRTNRRRIDEIGKIIVACSAAVSVLIIVIFFQRELFSSRFIVLLGWIFSTIFVAAGRMLTRAIQRLLIRRGIGMHTVVLVGTGAIADQLVHIISVNPKLGYRLRNRLPNVDEERLGELEELLERDPFDEIILADPQMSKDRALVLKEFATLHHVAFKYAPDLYDTAASHVELETFNDVPVFEVKRTKLDGWGKIIKRTFDFVLSAMSLVILFPLFLLIGLLIKIDSVGPVFVRLSRVGEKGRTFNILKFRSMIKDAHALKRELLNLNERPDGPLFKIKNDPRITRVGRFLRKTSIDELPQLWNVLKGEMSLVGPRPHEPEEVARYEQRHRKLLTIKPGVTGLAQISGRSELQFDDEAKLDIYYIEHWSLGLDLHILARTPFVVLSAKTAS